MKLYLYSILFGAMLKTSDKNAKEMYNKLDLNVLNTLGYLETVINSLAQSNYMSEKFINRVHLLYDEIIKKNPENRTRIIESYNDMKSVLNTCHVDGYELYLYDDILRREFGVFHDDPLRLYDDKQNTFYAFHYDELMDDIAFDYYTINYLLTNDSTLDNEINLDPRFLKSIRYVIWSLGNEIDSITKIKIIQTLKYRETMLKGFKKISVINEQNKLIRRLNYARSK